ncbi:MAG: hypothetical protein HC842_02390 [Cytophagales bacterium]|nr:hypothetical protein [Cytophagales bacterium]
MEDRLIQEKEFYKKKSNELGGKLLQTQEELTRLKADLKRSKLTATIIGQAYKIADADTDIPRFL